MFDINKFRNEKPNNTRYERRIEALKLDEKSTKSIENVVGGALSNIENNVKSFVIYGEPQSGKTEMMIALTAKLLDKGYQIVIILMNDSVQLLDQNLERFQRSGLDPSPKKFSEILDPSVAIGKTQWVIFSKKNSKDLRKLIDKLNGTNGRVVIDDEADYATPNSKINKREKSKINELTGELIGQDGIYIGVTATPARLDLNNTHGNYNDKWLDFLPHPTYKGQDVFFPTPLSSLQYILKLLPDQGDQPKYLRNALFGFMVNVSFLNKFFNESEKNYSILIHTSGKKVDHAEDYKQIVKILDVLRNEEHKKYPKYLENIWRIAQERYPGYEDDVIKYIVGNKDRNNIVVMNSDKEKNVSDNKSATSPSTLFTIVIGGNIVSRGVTFDNLLSMFFTRDVKHKFQQDTYIQRARMFGSRGNYLKYFELSIPETLYLNWHKCFIFHRLSLESRRTGNGSPVWLEDNKVSPVSSSSVDRTTVAMHSGEMSFEKFDYEQELINVIMSENSTNNLEKLKGLSDLLSEKCLPKYLINYIENFSPVGDNSILIHNASSIVDWKDAIQSEIRRPRGFIGSSELNQEKYPNAIHHIKIFYNSENKARLFYKYVGKIKFIKNLKTTSDNQ